MNTLEVLFVAFFVAVVLLIPGIGQAQTSELYLADWSTTDTYVVQAGEIVRQFSRSTTDDGPGLVVVDTIKFIGQDPDTVGHEYGLDGTPLVGEYSNPAFESLYDGATNGSRNWSIGHNDFATNFAVVEGDSDWGNLSVLFEPQRRSSGITYDANTGTLWIANTESTADRIQQYDLSGNLLSEFVVDIPGGYGISWDAADDTLWVPGSFGTNDLYQYDKKGNLLQIVTVQGLPNEIFGAEFRHGIIFSDDFESGDTSAWSSVVGT